MVAAEKKVNKCKFYVENISKNRKIGLNLISFFLRGESYIIKRLSEYHVYSAVCLILVSCMFTFTNVNKYGRTTNIIRSLCTHEIKTMLRFRPCKINFRGQKLELL